MQRIKAVRGPGAAALTPMDVEDITVLNLTRAAQAAIDLACHVLSTEGYGLPPSVSEAFTLLAQHSIIPMDLADRLLRLVAFRDIAIHDYQAIDPRIVESIVHARLDDLRTLGTMVVARFQVSG